MARGAKGTSKARKMKVARDVGKIDGMQEALDRMPGNDPRYDDLSKRIDQFGAKHRINHRRYN